MTSHRPVGNPPARPWPAPRAATTGTYNSSSAYGDYPAARDAQDYASPYGRLSPDRLPRTPQGITPPELFPPGTARPHSTSPTAMNRPHPASPVQVPAQVPAPTQAQGQARRPMPPTPSHNASSPPLHGQPFSAYSHATNPNTTAASPLAPLARYFPDPNMPPPGPVTAGPAADGPTAGAGSARPAMTGAEMFQNSAAKLRQTGAGRLWRPDGEPAKSNGSMRRSRENSVTNQPDGASDPKVGKPSQMMSPSTTSPTRQAPSPNFSFSQPLYPSHRSPVSAAQSPPLAPARSPPPQVQSPPPQQGSIAAPQSPQRRALPMPPTVTSSSPRPQAPQSPPLQQRPMQAAPRSPPQLQAQTLPPEQPLSTVQMPVPTSSAQAPSPHLASSPLPSAQSPLLQQDPSPRPSPDPVRARLAQPSPATTSQISSRSQSPYSVHTAVPVQVLKQAPGMTPQNNTQFRNSQQTSSSPPKPAQSFEPLPSQTQATAYRRPTAYQQTAYASSSVPPNATVWSSPLSEQSQIKPQSPPLQPSSTQGFARGRQSPPESHLKFNPPTAPTAQTPLPPTQSSPRQATPGWSTADQQRQTQSHATAFEPLGNQQVPVRPASATPSFASHATTSDPLRLGRLSFEPPTHNGNVRHASELIPGPVAPASITSPYKDLAQKMSNEHRATKAAQHLMRLQEAEKARVAIMEAAEDVSTLASSSSRPSPISSRDTSLYGRPNSTLPKSLQLTYEPVKLDFDLNSLLGLPSALAPGIPPAAKPSPPAELPEKRQIVSSPPFERAPDWPRSNELEAPYSPLDDQSIVMSTSVETADEEDPAVHELESTQSVSPERPATRDQTETQHTMPAMDVSPESKASVLSSRPHTEQAAESPRAAKAPEVVAQDAPQLAEQLGADVYDPHAASELEGEPNPNTTPTKAAEGDVTTPTASEPKSAAADSQPVVDIPMPNAVEMPSEREPVELEASLFTGLNKLRSRLSQRVPTRQSMPPTAVEPGKARSASVSSEPGVRHPSMTMERGGLATIHEPGAAAAATAPRRSTLPSQPVTFQHTVTPPFPDAHVELSASASVIHRPQAPRAPRAARHRSDVTVYNTLPEESPPLDGQLAPSREWAPPPPRPANPPQSPPNFSTPMREWKSGPPRGPSPPQQPPNASAHGVGPRSPPQRTGIEPQIDPRTGRPYVGSSGQFTHFA